jgi:diaminobutyrate-2-oxoglutarate transaminase
MDDWMTGNRFPLQPAVTRSSLAVRGATVEPYSFGENEFLQRQGERESSARSYPRRIPLALRRARGIYVEDVEGRTFIDCLACAGVLALGHNHPVVIEAVQRALRDELPMQTLDLTTPVKDAFVEEVFALLPPSFARHARIQFCGPTGADAVEASLKLVKTATERSGIAAFHGAYHGMTQGALALMGNLEPKRRVAPDGKVQFLPYPYQYRCPFGLGGEAGLDAGLRYIETVLSDPESGVLPPAGIIVEPIQGEGGVVPAPARWLKRLRELTAERQIPLILDEVQTGIARTGSWFAFQQADIEPDVLVLSKAIGGGLPLSVVVYHEKLDRWRPGAHAGTFRGNQLAMVAGVATLHFARTERLEQRASAMGARLAGRLVALQERYPFIGDVRGRGLMLGMEIVDPRSSGAAPPPAHPALASGIQMACLKRGLILELGGRHGAVVRMLPPLIITATEIDQVADIIESGCEEVARNLN